MQLPWNLQEVQFESFPILLATRLDYDPRLAENAAAFFYFNGGLQVASSQKTIKHFAPKVSTPLFSRMFQMRRQHPSSTTYFGPLNKMSHAIALTIGLSGISVHAWAQTQISSDQNTQVVANATSVTLDPNVQITANNMGALPAISITNGGSVTMSPGSGVNASGASDAVLMNEGNFSATGASLSTNGLTADVLQLQGGSTANLTNTNLIAQGVSAHALLILGGTAALGNTATISGGTLSSNQAEAVLVQDNNANATLSNTTLSGVNAVHMTGGATTANTATINNSTLTGTTGSAILMDGSNNTLSIDGSTVASNNAASSININGAGNTLTMTGGTVSQNATSNALNVNAGTATITGTQLRTNNAASLHVANVSNGGQLSLINANVVGTSTAANSGAVEVADATSHLTATNTSFSSSTDSASAIRTGSVSTAIGRVDITGGSITYTGANGDGFVVGNNGVQASTLSTLNNVAITTTGAASNGAGLFNGNTVMNGGSIASVGIGMRIGAIGAPTIFTTVALGRFNNVGTTIATTGVNAHGLLIRGAMSAATPHMITLDGTRITTQDASADGIQVNAGRANITAGNGTTISAGSGNLLHAMNGSNVNFTVDNSNLTGNIIADASSTANVFLQNGTTLTGMIDPVNLTMADTTTWNVTADSDVIGFVNYGKVIYQAPVGNAFKMVKADSLTGTGGRITMNTRLGGSDSLTDKLYVTGDSSGANLLTINNAGGKGALTSGNGIRVVQIDGSSPADNFTLANGPLEVGAYEYFLKQGAPTRASDWYLRSTFRAAVPGYMMTPGLNQEYGYTTLGTLQERVGDYANIARSEKQTQPGNGVWGRLQGSQYNKDTHDALSASVHDSFMQFGKDWTLSSNADGSSTHAGATVTLGQSKARFYDGNRALLNPVGGNGTGKVDTDATGIGGYWTTYRADGSYLDLVGQVTLYRNKYLDNAAHAASNKATGVALSAEAGKPFALSESMRIEPQAQLIYQYLNSKSFSDYLSTISANTNNAVRGRLGVRLFRDMATAGEPRSATPYLTLDVLHNFTHPVTVNVGDDALQANENKTWAEIGTGIDGRVSTQGQWSAALKYRHQLSGQTHEGVAGQVSYRYNW